MLEKREEAVMSIFQALDLRGLVQLLANNTAGEGDLKRKVASLQASYDKLVRKERSNNHV